MFDKIYDIIIIGAGHAGCEASLASARMGADTLLLTISIDNIGLMSCNPAVGGLGKGNLVKDLDSLGGEMAKNIDATGIQFRILNRKKGTAVQSSRSQADKYLYKNRMNHTIMNQPSLTVKQAIVTEIIAPNSIVTGVETACGQRFGAKKIVICAGTFIDGRIYIGEFSMSAGRMYEPAGDGLARSLKNLGFIPERMKTDTPARIHLDSIDTDGLEIHEADLSPIPFSGETDKIILPQIYCYTTHTNENTMRIIKDNLHRSVFYNGAIIGRGPRYCPSIEDKAIKFPDKFRHSIVLEPEGLDAKEVHANGFSTSLPVDVQLAAYRSMKGLEHCEFTRPAYAIQYDIYQPTGLFPTYETKLIKGLYFAGQMNGTSGYEEAAVQGFMAGVNAVLSIDNKNPLILGRDESYIGVLTDDLVTKGVDEPYRIFSSRSEYRLLLREDNTESRLLDYGYRLGLISSVRYDRYKADELLILAEEERLRTTLIRQTALETDLLAAVGVSINQSMYAADILRRPEMSYDYLLKIIGGGLTERLNGMVESRVKYAGYIDKQQKEVDRYKSLEQIAIPSDFNYSGIPGLRAEYAERLERVRPLTLGQAMRIPNLALSAIAVLDVELAKLRRAAKDVSRETR